MMRRTNIYLNTDHWRQLAALGKAEGLKPSHLIRVAILQFIRREMRKQTQPVVVSGRKRRSAVRLAE